MQRAFLNLLKWQNADISNEVTEEDEIMEGDLVIGDKTYPVTDGVPCFLTDTAEKIPGEQELTNKTFSFKWGEACTKYNDESFKVSMKFVLKRLKPLGIHSEEDFKKFLSGRKRILEVGSGMGWMSLFMAQNTDGIVVSDEIGEGVFSGHKLCRKMKNCHMVKADLMDLPFADHSFDYIHADGVLHHTPDCKAAVKALYDKLNRGGYFGSMFTEK